jgi:hypothetical protein
MRKITFLIAILISSGLSAETFAYEYKPAGISFSHKNLSIDKAARREKPFSEVFQSGSAPFSVSVHFKQILGAGSLDEFIKMQVEEHKKGGYTNEIEISLVTQDGSDAYEIIRDSKLMKVRWFIFKSKKDNILYSFWLSESKMLKKENDIAIEGYEEMKSSLKL